jgi:hypothetical protein
MIIIASSAIEALPLLTVHTFHAALEWTSICSMACRMESLV